jgi:predicted GNAT family acetyltransferase
MVLVTVDGVPAAVVGLKPLSDDGSELKRMYVRPSFRGLGIGRRLIEYVIKEARVLGYRQLNTIDFMTGARRLYRSAGFADCPPYRVRPPATEWTTTGSTCHSISAPAEPPGENNERARSGVLPGARFSRRRLYRRSGPSSLPCGQQSSARCPAFGARLSFPCSRRR